MSKNCKTDKDKKISQSDDHKGRQHEQQNQNPKTRPTMITTKNVVRCNPNDSNNDNDIDIAEECLHSLLLTVAVTTETGVKHAKIRTILL